MTKEKNLIIGNSAVELIKGLGMKKYENSENISTYLNKNYRRAELVISGQINYFKMLTAEEAVIRIKGIPLKVKGIFLKALYVCFEKGDFINIVIELNSFNFEVTRVFGYNAYSKLWCIHRDDVRDKLIEISKEIGVIREGILEDILEKENGSIAVEFDGNFLEVQPKHFQKVLYYMTSEATVKLKIDMKQRKLLSIEAKDPEARVPTLQKYLFLRELEKGNPTNESLMHYYNFVEHTYFNLIKGKISEIKEDRRVS